MPDNRQERQARLAGLPAHFTALSDLALTSDEAYRDSFRLVYSLGPVYDILRNKDTRPPMAIAIYGDWGTGKTTAMQWLDDLLHKGHSRNEVKVKTVWFYPWKYHAKEDVWRGLIAEVVLKSIDVKEATPGTVVKAAKQFGFFLGRSFLHVLASVKLKAAAGIAEAEMDLASIKEILAEYREAAHPEQAFLNYFEQSLKEWIHGTLRKNERMVIFVDDLDRCMPEVALQVLEALKLYLNIEKLVFVVGLDKPVIEQQVVKHYEELGVDREKAKKYLDKMFQVEVTLTPRDKQIEDFLDEQLQAFDYWKKNLSKAHQAIFRRLILDLAEGNPRQIKRLINSASMYGAGVLMAEELDQ